MAVGDILLGEGVFYLNTTPIALTRGGGSFSVEREYREIEADGDYGPVKGRVRKIRSRAKLVLNALELLETNIAKFYPALDYDTAGAGATITAKDQIENADYQDEVAWVGRTLSGKQVRIELYNAINLENIEWKLVDKEEVVPEITYTATYSEDSRTTEPWEVVFANEAYYTL